MKKNSLTKGINAINKLQRHMFSNFSFLLVLNLETNEKKLLERYKLIINKSFHVTNGIFDTLAHFSAAQPKFHSHFCGPFLFPPNFAFTTTFPSEQLFRVTQKHISLIISSFITHQRRLTLAAPGKTL